METEEEINLICEFCNSWYLPKKIKALEKGLVQDLKSKGYKAKLEIESSNSAAKPYYLFLKNGNNKIIILSNNASLHRKEGAIIDYNINDFNRKKVVDKIIDTFKKMKAK